MDINTTIAENLTEWMADHKTLNTMKKLAAKSGVGFGTIQRIKNGEGNITAKNMALIASAFNRNPAELMIPSPQKSFDEVQYSARTTRITTQLIAAELLPLPIKSEREKMVERINDLLPTLSDFGLVAVLEKAKDAARDYPVAKETLASSQ